MPTLAIVRTPIAAVHAEPRVSSAQTTQALFGRALLVLDAEGEWQRVRTLHDGYEGWAHAGALDRVPLDAVPDDAERFGAYAERTFAVPATHPITPDDPAAVRAAFGGAPPAFALGCTVEAGARRLHLPLGAVVHAEQRVVAGDAVALDVQPTRFPARADAVCVSAAALFEGTSYQWGGVTPWGADCSGFVQTLFALHGVDLPRDAWQQARVGVPGAPALADAAAGDLLFFADAPDARPDHVGLALGGGRMAHLALGRGGWAVEALDDADDPYVARLRDRFVGARRVIG